jgi:hypothetical protein
MGTLDGDPLRLPTGGAQMFFDHQVQAIVGDHGSLQVGNDDEVSRKLAMLIEGECEGLGPTKAAEKYGFTKQRYFQLRRAYEEGGAQALASKIRGPKRNYRRTDELVRQVIRHRFLDPEASADVIAQKLRQTDFSISTRSVERVIADYGLQKKTLRVPPAS